MRSLLHPRALIGVLVVAALPAAGQSNDAPLNNGADVAYFYSDPSVGSVPAVGVLGDLYWRAHTGANMLNDVDAALGGSFMEIDGYYESLYDSDWTTTPSFYDRAHTGMVALLPDLADLLPGGPGVTVVIGPSGFGAPCTLAPSLCSPATALALCGPPATVIGWVTDIGFGPTVGAGVVLTAAGLAADDIATTWLIPGGMTVFAGPPGPCGIGDYVWQDLHSTDETQGGPAAGLNPSGGSQFAGVGLVNEALTSMTEGHETWRGNVINVVAQTGVATGVELGSHGGGAMNGRNLTVAGGTALLGVEVRDFDGAAVPTLGVGAASLAPIPNPGIPVLGGALLILPDGVFNTTSSIWVGPIAPVVFDFTPEGAFASPLLPVPAGAAGATLFLQGFSFDPVALAIDSTNRTSLTLW